MGNTRLRLQGNHLAYVDTELLNLFMRKKGIIKINPYIMRICKIHYNINIYDPDAIEQLKEVISKDYYVSIGEWIHECMRNELREMENNND